MKVYGITGNPKGLCNRLIISEMGSTVSALRQRWRLGDEGEVDAAVVALFHKVGMLREGVLISVLQDEITLRVEKIQGENEVRDGLKAFKGVRRVCEDNVEFLPADGEEIKDVVTDHCDIGKPKP